VRAAGGAVAVLAVLLFLANVGWMVRHRKRPPPSRPAFDLPLVHVAGALLSLLAATACGVALLWQGPLAAPGLRAAYGVLGLLGCFGQLIAGVEQRLVGWLAWLRAYTASAFERVPPTPYDLLARPLQGLVAAAWLVAVALLATGAAAAETTLVRGGAAALAAATLGGAALLGAAARRAGRPA
jgi:hypothetical protein